MKLEDISSREDLTAYVHDLAQKARDGCVEWENDRLDLFLEALAAWITDSPGWFLNQGDPVPDQPNWRMVGQMLQAATVYE